MSAYCPPPYLVLCEMYQGQRACQLADGTLVELIAPTQPDGEWAFELGQTMTLQVEGRSVSFKLTVPREFRNNGVVFDQLPDLSDDQKAAFHFPRCEPTS